MLRRYGPILLVIIVIVGVIAYVGSRGDDDDNVNANGHQRRQRERSAADLSGGEGQGHRGRHRLGRHLRHGDGSGEDARAQRVSVRRAAGRVGRQRRCDVARRHRGLDHRGAVQGSARPAAAGDRRRRGRRHGPERGQPGVDRLPEHVRRRRRDVRAQARHPDRRSQRRTGRRDGGAGRRAEGDRHGRVRRARWTRADTRVVAGDRRRQDRLHVRRCGVGDGQPRQRAVPVADRPDARAGRRPSLGARRQAARRQEGRVRGRPRTAGQGPRVRMGASRDRDR